VASANLAFVSDVHRSLKIFVSFLRGLPDQSVVVSKSRCRGVKIGNSWVRVRVRVRVMAMVRVKVNRQIKRKSQRKLQGVTTQQ